MGTLQWGGYALTGPTLSPLVATANTTVKADASVKGAPGTRYLVVDASSEQKDDTGLAEAAVQIGFVEEFEVLPDGNPPVTLTGHLSIQGKGLGYSDDSYTTSADRNTGTSNLSGTLNFDVHEKGVPTNILIDFTQVYDLDVRGHLVAETVPEVYNMVDTKQAAIDITKVWVLKMNFEVKAKSNVTLVGNNPTTTEARTKIDIPVAMCILNISP